MTNEFEDRARKAAEALRNAIDESELKDQDGVRTVKRRRANRIAAVSGVSAVAIFATLASLLPTNNGNHVRLGNNDSTFALAGALKPFSACEDTQQYFKDNAYEYYLKAADKVNYTYLNEGTVTTTTIDGSSSIQTPRPQSESLTGADTSADGKSAAKESTLDSASQYSTTNVAEPGVDEPDIVKTDGKHVITVSGGKIHFLNITDDGLKEANATIKESGISSIFLNGSKLVTFSNNYANVILDSINPSNNSHFSVYDISNFDQPKFEGSYEMTGNMVDARMSGTKVSFVSTYTPDIAMNFVRDNDYKITESSKQDLRNLVDKRRLSEWLPSFAISDESGKVVDKGQAVDCKTIGHPETFSGITTTAVVTFDVSKSFGGLNSAAVLGGGQKIYASKDRLFITSTDWEDQSTQTSIHAFTMDDSRVRYLGSGAVEGTLLNQYSMSEYDGVLRVATTSSRKSLIFQKSITSGQVTLLKLDSGKLNQVGSVTGLGAKDNESIYSVRFVRDKGYVSTFRQTDPFYVLDLKDSTQPRIAGELKIPGFTSYLHPVGENLILGVGKSARGTVEFSLFSVSDPAKPKKVASRDYGSGSAGAESDAKAFLYWQPRNLVISPLNTYNDGIYDPSLVPSTTSPELQLNDGTAPTTTTTVVTPSGPADASSPSNIKTMPWSYGSWQGLVLLEPTESGLRQVGLLKDISADYGQTLRTFVIGNIVYQLSTSGIQANSLDTHQKIGAIKFDESAKK